MACSAKRLRIRLLALILARQTGHLLPSVLSAHPEAEKYKISWITYLDHLDHLDHFSRSIRSLKDQLDHLSRSFRSLISLF